MRTILALALLAASASAASAQYGRTYGYGSNSSSHYVRPYTRSDGGYVGGHYRTNPDSSRSNNYGAYGNYNPYSGSTGDGYGGSRRRSNSLFGDD